MATKTTTTRTERARWQTAGGGSLTAGSIALLVATAIEYFVLTGGGLESPAFWPFAAAFALNALLFAVAAWPLAFGDNGRNGVVGRLIWGKVGFLAFGVSWLIGQGIYLTAFFVSSDSARAGLETAAVVFTGVMFLGAVAAAIAVAVAHIATGLARWSLLAALVVSGVTQVIAGGSDSPALITVMHLISTLGLIFVGVTYLRPLGAPGAAAAR